MAITNVTLLVVDQGDSPVFPIPVSYAPVGNTTAGGLLGDPREEFTIASFTDANENLVNWGPFPMITGQPYQVISGQGSAITIVPIGANFTIKQPFLSLGVSNAIPNMPGAMAKIPSPFTIGNIVVVAAGGQVGDSGIPSAALAIVTATGTNDDQRVQAALAVAAQYGVGRVLCVGPTPFVPSQTVLNRYPGVTLDLGTSVWNIPASFTPSGDKVFALGRSAGHVLGCSRDASTGVLTFITTEEPDSLPGDVGYMFAASGTLPTGISPLTQYWLVNITNAPGSQSFSLSLTQNGLPITGPDAGSGTTALGYAPYSWNPSTQILTVQGTSPPQFMTGQIIRLNSKSGLPPTGLVNAPQDYYIQNVGTNQYKLWYDAALTSQATASDAGTAPLSLMILPVTVGCNLAGGTINLASGVSLTIAVVKFSRSSKKCLASGVVVNHAAGSTNTSFWGSGSDNSFVNNLVNGGKWGLYGGQMSINLLFDGNVVNGCAIGINGAGNGSTQMRILRNQVSYCTNAGIVVGVNAVNAAVGENNTFSNSTSGDDGNSDGPWEILDEGTNTQFDINYMIPKVGGPGGNGSTIKYLGTGTYKPFNQ